MSLHDPYQIATCGQNSRNTATLASNGILVDVFIEDLPPIIPPDPEILPGGGIIPGQEWPKEEKQSRKKVTVVATINGTQYTESVIIENQPTLSVKDINIDISTHDDKPRIKITLKN